MPQPVRGTLCLAVKHIEHFMRPFLRLSKANWRMIIYDCLDLWGISTRRVLFRQNAYMIGNVFFEMTQPFCIYTPILIIMISKALVKLCRKCRSFACCTPPVFFQVTGDLTLTIRFLLPFRQLLPNAMSSTWSNYAT